MGYAGTESNGLITLNDGNYSIRMADTYGDGWNGNVFSHSPEENWETTYFLSHNLMAILESMIWSLMLVIRESMLANQNMLIHASDDQPMV